MGIGLPAAHLLGQVFKGETGLSEKRLLTLGVQGCEFTLPDINRVLSRDGFGQVDEINQGALFRALGIGSVAALDASPYEGAGIIHDLNEQVPPELVGWYDLIFDGGTSEHVFSTERLFRNLVAMCKVGGLVIHMSPVDWVNHGFYNLSAELLRDVYGCNGFDLVTLKYIGLPPTQRHYLEFEPERLNVSLQPYYRLLVFGAFRKVESRPFQIPQQGVYRNKLWKGETTEDSPSLAKRARRKVAALANRHPLTAFLVSSLYAKSIARKIVL